MRILYVEDEESIRELVRINLEAEDYEVVVTGQPTEALRFIEEQHFDLILLDIMLPGLSGLDICEQIRLRNFETPIIFLTAKGTTYDRIAGLKKGADDYLVKPFHLEELLLRVNNLIKRTSKAPENAPEVYQFGPNRINFRTFEAETPNGRFTLTRREAMLLKLLVERKNEVVSRNQILQAVWGYDVFPSTRTIDNFILAFRKYFEPNQRMPRYFHAVRGVGYKFTE